jgi:hypothetical protein
MCVSIGNETMVVIKNKKFSTATAKFYGSKGGKSRAKNLTPKQKTEIARKAAFARWGKKT